ncbi:hypothetical protein FRC06_003987, partial [Ceratobasidium sp. 370]
MAYILTKFAGYRAARVCLIFKPPNTLQHIYREHLAYIEIFAPFSQTNNTPHSLYTTSTALRPDGCRQVVVVPISQLHMTCHIAPQFARVDPDIRLNGNTDLFACTRHFFFNQYCNHYSYQIFKHWRKRTCGNHSANSSSAARQLQFPPLAVPNANRSMRLPAANAPAGPSTAAPPAFAMPTVSAPTPTTNLALTLEEQHIPAVDGIVPTL